MQTPNARNGSLEGPLKVSPKTARQAKILIGSDSDHVPVRWTPKKATPKVTDRKSSPTSASELTHLQEELKRTKEQLNLSETFRKQAIHEAELAKCQLAATSDKLDEAQKQLIELSASEDDRILELRQLSHDRDRAWQSELEALQKQHISDSSALAFAHNEITKLKFDLKESLFFIDELKSQLKDCSESKQSLPLEESKAMDVEFSKKNNGELEKLRVELNCEISEVARLKNALVFAEKRYQEEYSHSTFQIRSAYELFERTKSEFSAKKAELESKLKKAEEEIKALEAKKSISEKTEKNQNEEKELEIEIVRKKLEDDLEVLKIENKMLKMEIEKKENESNKANNETVGLVDSEEMRRLKIQSGQWRKAAEVATALLSNENVDKFLEKTSCVDNYHTIGGKLELPFYEDIEEELTKKKNATMLKKIGVLLKGGHK